MKIKDLFEKWNLTGLQAKTPIMKMEWKPSDPDKEATWGCLILNDFTQITKQPPPDEDGVEQTALESVYVPFGITRQTLKEHGRSCIEFTKIAIILLNQVIRPFTAKWHRKRKTGAFDSPEQCTAFRLKLQNL